MSTNDVLQHWIQDANEGRIKDGSRALSKDELALVGNVLRAVAGDLLMADPSPQPGNEDGLDAWWLKWHGRRVDRDAWEDLKAALEGRDGN